MCTGDGKGIEFLRALTSRKKAADDGSSSGGLFALPANTKAGSSRAAQRVSAPLPSLMAAFGPQIGPNNG